MKLLIDLGNTRLKACVYDSELRLMNDVSDVNSLQQWLNQHGSALSSAGIACVGAIELAQRIEQVLSVYIEASSIYRIRYRAEVLASDYVDPGRLGIDRWLALLPFVSQGQAIVVDAGTAFTVDVLDGARHVGGYILPGLRLQREVLAAQTASVNFESPGMFGTELGLTTAACVSHGSLLSLVALAQAVTAERVTVKAYITGGDAMYFTEYLGAELRPLLVFEGMLIALNNLLGDAQ